MSEQNTGTSKPFYKNGALWFVFIYILFITLYTLAFKNSDGKNVLLSSNELGDFLAGTFAPLAFLYLYLGYKNQGEELKQNTEALRLQAIELSNSVKQQTKLVDTAKKELEITINKITKDNQLQLTQAQPFFHIYDLKVKVLNDSDSNSSATYFVFILDFINSRTICRSLYFTFNFEENSHDYILDGSVFDIVEVNLKDKIRVNLHTTSSISDVTELPFTLYLNFFYTDAYDEIQRQTIKIQLGKNANSNERDHIYQWFSKSFTN